MIIQYTKFNGLFCYNNMKVMLRFCDDIKEVRHFTGWTELVNLF